MVSGWKMMNEKDLLFQGVIYKKTRKVALQKVSSSVAISTNNKIKYSKTEFTLF